MIEKTLAKRYASALIVLSEKVNAVERIGAELVVLKDVYQSNAEFRLILKHPRISKSRKFSLMDKLFKGKFHDLLFEFLSLLIEKGRANFIPEIVDSYVQLADASRGLVRVKVRTFLPLGKERLDALNSNLFKLMNKKLLLDVSQDRTLKGGLAVRIGDRVIDGSVSGRLKKLREELYEKLYS